MTAAEVGKEVLSARKDDEITFAAAGKGAKVDKIPPLFKAHDIDAGGIGALVVGIPIEKSGVEKKGKIRPCDVFIGLQIGHNRTSVFPAFGRRIRSLYPFEAGKSTKISAPAFFADLFRFPDFLCGQPTFLSPPSLRDTSPYISVSLNFFPEKI